MNERIQELVRQAVIAVDDPFPGNPLNDELEKMYIPDCFAEKFAELIVKECMEQVIGQYLPVMEDKEMMKDTHWDGYVQCGVDSVVAIREHFGVE